MRHRLILNFNKPVLFLPFCLTLSLLFCSCQTNPVQSTGYPPLNPYLVPDGLPSIEDIKDNVHPPLDKAEFESVWQFLKAFSIYQDKVPEASLAFKRPEEMFYCIEDTFKGNYYTFYDSDYAAYQAVLEKYSGNDIASFEKVTDKTGILRITTFYREDVYEQFLNCITEIPVSCENMIIDLRGNLGGFIPEAVSVVEAFLPRGTAFIMATERNLKYGSEAATIKGPWYTGSGRQPVLARMKNLIVWMDESTASASEILAVALKDCAKALLVGSRSSGKGIGQVILQRNNRPGLKITYLKLSGRPGSTGDYHGIGLTPDVEINGSSEDVKKAAVVRLVEPTFAGKIKSSPAPFLQKTSTPACFKIIYEDSLYLNSDY